MLKVLPPSSNCSEQDQQYFVKSPFPKYQSLDSVNTSVFA